MPVQNYTINTRDEVAGVLYGMQQTRALLQSAKVVTAPLDFGVGVKQVNDREVTAGFETGVGDFRLFGISLRQLTTESDFRPNTGAAFYPVGAIAPIVRDGVVNVISQEACNLGDRVYVDQTTGKFYSTAGAGRELTTNCIWDVTAAAGAVARLVITTAMQEPNA